MIKKIFNWRLPVVWGSFRKLQPISQIYGLDRGNSIDRYYIEKFLKKHSSHITGKVLEIGDNRYTLKFGKDVVHSEILDINRKNPMATIHADLRDKKSLPQNRFDCVILTQVLQYLDDLDSTIANFHLMLKPKGILLATVPCVARIDCVAKEKGDFWRFTKASIKYLFEKKFAKQNLKIEAFGNVLSVICFMEGVSVEEVKPQELDFRDKDFPLVVCLKAVK